MKRLLTSLLLFAAAHPALAQTGNTAGAQTGAVAVARPQYEEVKDYLIRSAEEMPQEGYAFKPTAEVRSFGELVGHLAGSHEAFCGAALGTPRRESAAYEKLTAKAELVAALRRSYEECDRAYAISDADAAAHLRMFGQDMTKLGVLIMNIAHDNLHYGNLVTYLRMKSLVPPSSQPRPRT